MRDETDKVGHIRNCYLFTEADEASVGPLAERSTLETVPKNRDIFTMGDEVDGLRILLNGLVRIWINDAQGRELTLTLIEPGDAFGEIALLDGSSRSANATVIEPARMIVLRRGAFLDVLDRNPALSRHIIVLLCDRMRRMTDDLRGFAFQDIRVRLSGKLLELAMDHSEIEGGHARFTRKFSQTEFAHMLGATREAINKRLAALAFDGLVTLRSGWIEIPDLDALRAVAEPDGD